MNYLIILILSISLILNINPAYAQQQTINSIKINGNKRSDYKTICSYLGVKIGDSIDDTVLDNIIKNLYATQLFSNINAHVNEDNTLVISVNENPFVNEIKLKGNRFFSDTILKNNVLKLKPTSIFTQNKLKSDLMNLIQFYRNSGRLGVKIESQVTEQNNKVNILLNINEGPLTTIKSIQFLGNTNFPDSQLKQIIKSKERTFYRFFNNTSDYIQDRLMLDQSLITYFYSTHGYINAKIKSVITEINDNYKDAYVTFSIAEGKKYDFGNYKIIIDGKLNTQDIQQKITSIIKDITPKTTFNVDKVDKVVQNITTYINNNGYLFAYVEPKFITKDTNNTVDIEYHIFTGKKTYINNISITGNTRTIDKVILNKLKVSAGDAYNIIAIEKSRRNIINLGFFEHVEIASEKISPTLVDLNVNVKEKGTGTIELGGGFSSISGPIGTLNIKERNLFGTGRELALLLEKSPSSFSSSIEFTEPKLFDTDLSLGFNVFHLMNEHKRRNYSNSNSGFATQVAYNITDNLIGALRYSYKYSNIYNVGEKANLYIKEQEGETTDSSIGYSLSYNRLDNYFQPTDGYLLKLSQDLSGIGGNLHYIRTEGYFAYFIPVFKKINKNIVLKFKPSFGYVAGYKQEPVKIGQRFFKEIRGFDLDGIGPRDIKTLESLGGKFYLTSTLQLDFPIGLPEDLKIKGSLFLDVATLSGIDDYNRSAYYDSKSIRASIGFGITWHSPIAPMRLDFAVPILKSTHDVKNLIRFSIDTGI